MCQSIIVTVFSGFCSFLSPLHNLTTLKLPLEHFINSCSALFCVKILDTVCLNFFSFFFGKEVLFALLIRLVA